MFLKAWSFMLLTMTLAISWPQSTRGIVANRGVTGAPYIQPDSTYVFEAGAPVSLTRLVRVLRSASFGSNNTTDVPGLWGRRSNNTKVHPALSSSGPGPTIPSLVTMPPAQMTAANTEGTTSKRKTTGGRYRNEHHTTHASGPATATPSGNGAQQNGRMGTGAASIAGMAAAIIVLHANP
ncbi:hypothetical protein BDV59DRAFT_206269 [Aspergillus ambiguus]|uniref:uncharacterized protein n=1 Tax=Aspergillus ambiguus TaxID=176160 RepID=UPI003CCE3D17